MLLSLPILPASFFIICSAARGIITLRKSPGGPQLQTPPCANQSAPGHHQLPPADLKPQTWGLWGTGNHQLTQLVLFSGSKYFYHYGLQNLQKFLLHIKSQLGTKTLFCSFFFCLLVWFHILLFSDLFFFSCSNMRRLLFMSLTKTLAPRGFGLKHIHSIPYWRTTGLTKRFFGYVWSRRHLETWLYQRLQFMKSVFF